MTQDKYVQAKQMMRMMDTIIKDFCATHSMTEIEQAQKKTEEIVNRVQGRLASKRGDYVGN